MNEVDQIFNSISEACGLVLLQDKVVAKRKQLRTVLGKTCGNCWHWMKSSCKPEKVKHQFKSINSVGCKDFELDTSCGLVEKFKKELVKLETDLLTATRAIRQR